jgi:hypothetical protein
MRVEVWNALSVCIESLPAADLIKTVVKRCDVSVLAARVRLKQLNLPNEPLASASDV